MIVGFEWSKDSVLLNIAGEIPAERALLTHFQKGHVAILCAGAFQNNGLRVFIRNEREFDHAREIEDRLGRKGILERRKKGKPR